VSGAGLNHPAAGTGQPVTLRSGHRVLIRPIRRDDAAALGAAVEQLSEQTRYRRFHSAKPHLSQSMLRYLTDLDHHHHEALVALPKGSSEIVGVARFIRDVDSTETAELAIVVVDSWQRRGLGTVLVHELGRRAADVGIAAFTAEILADNTPTIELVRHLGPTDLTRHGATLSARIGNSPLQGDGQGDGVHALRAMARAKAVLVPRLARRAGHLRPAGELSRPDASRAPGPAWWRCR